MISLTYEQKKSLGFQFLLDQMSADCVYGQEQIRQCCPYTPGEWELLQQELSRLGALTEGYGDHRGFWDRVERILMNLKEIRGSLKRAGETVLTDLELFECKQFLLQMEKMWQLYQEEQAVELVGISWRDCRGALELLDPEGRRLPGFYLADAYDEELRGVREEKKRLEVLLRQERSDKEKADLLGKRQALVAREEQIAQKVRQRLTDGLQPYLNDMEENCRVAGKLDFLLQKAKLALAYGGICPRVDGCGVPDGQVSVAGAGGGQADRPGPAPEGGRAVLRLLEMRNPMLEESLKERGKEFAPISFSMEEGCAVITGANMGGKSVALRTLALQVALAQSGFFVYAKEAELPMFDHISLIAEEYQAMGSGLSSFGGEIMELSEALNCQKQGFSLMIFDELARGTNPDEGAVIVRAAVQYLKKRRCMAIFATHYDHVAEYGDYHYQVMGLRNVDMQKLRQEIEGIGARKGIDVIAKYMDYGIYQVHGAEECPRDAIHICGLLGLEPELLGLIEGTPEIGGRP